MTENKKHEWESTDSQGYSMECVKCGEYIGLQDNENWNKHLNADCPKSDET